MLNLILTIVCCIVFVSLFLWGIKKLVAGIKLLVNSIMSSSSEGAIKGTMKIITGAVIIALTFYSLQYVDQKYNLRSIIIKT